MERQKKEENITDLQERFANVQTAFVAEYQGLTVADLNALRRDLREVAGEYRVAKNTLVALAVEGTPYLSLKDLLKGQNGLVFGYGDAVDVAKVVSRYAGENGKFIVKGGVTEGQFLDPSQVEALAKLPSRDALRAQLLGLLSQPATQLVGVLAAPASQLARVFNARAEKEGQSAEEKASTDE